MSEAVVVRSEIETPMIVLKAELVSELTSITEQCQACEVEDQFGLTAADQFMKQGKDLLKLVEDERKKVKAPVLALGAAIDEAAKKYTAPLTASQVELAGRIRSFERKQEEIRQAAEAKARKEREEFEAAQRKQAEEIRKAMDKAAKSNEPIAPKAMAPVPAPVQPTTYVPPVVRSASVSSRKVKVLVIEDPTKIPYSIGGVVLLAPIEKAIENLLRVNIEVGGCRLEEKEITVRK